MNQPIDRVAVLGGGSAGLMTALTLRSMLPELDVTLVHSSDLPPIGVGESTTSLLPPFLHEGLRLDPREFYQAVRPTWKLGIRFDWRPAEEGHFYYPFDRPADTRSAGLGKENAYYHFADGQVFSPYTEMMDQQKAPCLPRPEGGYAIDHQYGYHIENRAFVRHLHDVALKRGIHVLDRRIKQINVDPAGGVAGVRLDDDNTLTAGLYVDCTGFASKLLGQALEEPFIDYRDSLFCDRAVTGTWPRAAGVLPYTTSQTMNHGWCWLIELTDRVNCGYVFSSQFCSEAEAAEELKSRHPMVGDHVGAVKFRSGRYERFWVNNVAAVGNAAGFVEPLEATGLHMVAVSARTLGQALVDSDRRVSAAMRRQINRFIAGLWDDIRDFLAIHFAFNRRLDTPFWRHCRENTNLAGARGLLDFYRQSGPSSIGAQLIHRNSIFRYEGYLTMLIGLGVPSDYAMPATDEERQRWQRLRTSAQEMAAAALSMDDGLAMAMPPT